VTIANTIGIVVIGLGPRPSRPRAGETPAVTELTTLPLPDKPSIAVLPFQNMSGDPEQEYFADGMVEEIITALSRIRWLFVIARNSAFTYKGRAVDVRQVGRELGVRYGFEDSVRKGGNRVRITAPLIDATSGGHLWADRYDRDLADIFVVQPRVSPGSSSRHWPPPSGSGYCASLPNGSTPGRPPNAGCGTSTNTRRRRTGLPSAFSAGRWRSTKTSPPGHYGYTLVLQWNIWHFSGRPLSEVQGIPREEVRLAVVLDDRDAMAHAVLAHIILWGSEWEAAIAEARIAFALNRNSTFVISMLDCVLGFAGPIGFASPCGPARTPAGLVVGWAGSGPPDSTCETLRPCWKPTSW
jgi:adenylate cyclase